MVVMGIEVGTAVMGVGEVGRVGSMEGVLSAGGVAGGFGNVLGCSSCSRIVVRRAVESVLPNPFVPCSMVDKVSSVMVIFGWRMGAKMSCPIH